MFFVGALTSGMCKEVRHDQLFDEDADVPNPMPTALGLKEGSDAWPTIRALSHSGPGATPANCEAAAHTLHGLAEGEVDKMTYPNPTGEGPAVLKDASIVVTHYNYLTGKGNSTACADMLVGAFRVGIDEDPDAPPDLAFALDKKFVTNVYGPSIDQAYKKAVAEKKEHAKQFKDTEKSQEEQEKSDTLSARKEAYARLMLILYPETKMANPPKVSFKKPKLENTTFGGEERPICEVVAEGKEQGRKDTAFLALVLLYDWQQSAPKRPRAPANSEPRRLTGGAKQQEAIAKEVEKQVRERLEEEDAKKQAKMLATAKALANGALETVLEGQRAVSSEAMAQAKEAGKAEAEVVWLRNKVDKLEERLRVAQAKTAEASAAKAPPRR